MKLHDLKPADGSRTPRRRVGRGIAAGQGKTAGRGTKGQKARAGGSIPPWFEGGQTPLHMRIPKLHGFRNRFKIDYEVVNVGRIGEFAGLGAFETDEGGGKKAGRAPITVNQEILRAVGLVRTLDKPMKVLGQGDIDVPLFVVADAFSKSAVAKIEAAGGSVQVLEIPTRAMPALGLESPAAPGPVASEPTPEAETVAPAETTADAPTKASARAVRPKASRPESGEAKTPAPKAAKPKAAKPKAPTDADTPTAPSTLATAEPSPAAHETAEGPLTDDAPAGEDA